MSGYFRHYSIYDRVRRAHLSCAVLVMLLTVSFTAEVLILTGCGGSSPAGLPGSSGSGKVKNEGKPGDYEIPGFRGVKFDKDKAEGNDNVKIDLSHTENGYISLICDLEKRIKLQVVCGDETYTYDVRTGRKQYFPLTCGDGEYSFHVMENVEDNMYSELYKTEKKVTLKDQFQPYIRPNQYADYSKDSECVKIAGELASEATCESDFAAKVYEYICDNVTYDYDLAENVPSDYIPDPDKTLEEGKGICFSYASLAASMLRSQGIPAKVIFGYVAPDDIYHAWNMFYTRKEGWVTVDFRTGNNSWNRLDLTFAANGADSDFIGDGSNYQEVYQY